MASALRRRWRTALSASGAEIACLICAAPDPHQAFLGDACDQRPVSAKDEPAREAARAEEIGTLLRIQQPFVGAEWAMVPKRMVETRAHELLLEQTAAVRHQRGIEQREVGRVGEHALMDRRIVGQLAGRLDPHVELAVLVFLAEVTVVLHWPLFDR